MTQLNSTPDRPAVRAGLAVGLVLFACSAVRADEPQAIPWRHDYTQARAEAQAQNLALWVQFTAPWCSSCRRMESETLVDPNVVATVHGRLIPVLVSFDASLELAQGFGITAIPLSVIVKPTGEVLARREGYADAATFRAFLEQAPVRSVPPTRIESRARSEAEGSVALTAASSRLSEGVALAGYCPVSLVRSRRLEVGRTSLSVHYDGREYRFATAEFRATFLKEPERYLPASGGACVVSQVDREQAVAGNPRYGVLYRGRLYLCADRPARDCFVKSPERYANADVADQGFCPHCRSEAGRPVRGLPQFALTHAGRRYLFPDAQHLESFRADPQRYLR